MDSGTARDASPGGMPAVLMETLLDIHRGRDPRALLRGLLERMAPMYGRAVACCYLADRPGAGLRIEALDDSDGIVTVERWRPEFHAPPAVLSGTTLTEHAPLLPRANGPVRVAESLPRLLDAVWAPQTVAMLRETLRPRRSVLAVISTPLGIVGFLLLSVAGDWPVDVAAACTAHAALALGRIAERRVTEPGGERFMERVIAGVAARELRSARDHQRPLSLAVLELTEPHPPPERLVAVATLVTDLVRRPDLIGYLAPRRLLVLLTDTPAEATPLFIRRLHKSVGAEFFGVTAATATFPADGRSWEDLLHCAAARLGAPPSDTAPEAPASGERFSFRRGMPARTDDSMSDSAAWRAAVVGRAAARARVAEEDGGETGAGEGAGGDAAPLPHLAGGDDAPRTAGQAEPVVMTASVAPAAPPVVSVVIRVAPVKENDDIAGWETILQRLPAMVSVSTGAYDGYTVNYETETHSMARLLGQLNHLGERVNATVTPTISGEIHLTLRTSRRPARTTP